MKNASTASVWVHSDSMSTLLDIDSRDANDHLRYWLEETTAEERILTLVWWSRFGTGGFVLDPDIILDLQRRKCGLQIDVRFCVFSFTDTIFTAASEKPKSAERIIELVIFPRQITTLEVTHLLGIEPNMSWEKGDVWETRPGYTSKRTRSLWRYETKSLLPFSESVNVAFSSFEAPSKWRHLVDGSIDLFFHWFSHGAGGPFISADDFVKLSMLKCALVFQPKCFADVEGEAYWDSICSPN